MDEIRNEIDAIHVMLVRLMVHQESLLEVFLELYHSTHPQSSDWIDSYFDALEKNLLHSLTEMHKSGVIQNHEVFESAINTLKTGLSDKRLAYKSLYRNK